MKHVSVRMIFVTALALLMVGCASTRIRQLSGEEFIQKAKSMETVSSFNWATYIGSTGKRAYLEYGEAPFMFHGNRTTVYWTTLSDLPDEVADQLRAGNSPWRSWTEDAAPAK